MTGRFFRRLLAVIGVVLAITILQVAALRFFDPPFSAFMLTDRITGAKSGLYSDWTPLSGISRDMARAVIASEDQKFFRHRGFDWEEIQDAWEDAQDGGRLRGASTISMQTARNMFLFRHRSWFRKGLEAYYTVLLEAFLPKNRILEIYLNIAEFGPDTYGVTEASRRYFNHPPSRLSAGQAAGLAVVLPAPKLRSPHKLSPSAARRKQWVLGQMSGIELPDWPRPEKKRVQKEARTQ